MKEGLSIALASSALRRIHGVKTVSSGAVNRTIPQAEFSKVLRSYQQEAAAQKSRMPAVVEGLWKSEGFATTFGKYRLDENTLNDPQVPAESWGIAHVGYGAASAEHARFNPDQLQEIAWNKCVPSCRDFMYEGTGSTLRIYEPGFFKSMCGFLGLIPKGAPPGPDRTGFFAKYLAAFNEHQQRLMTHGYGRLVAFSRISVYKAIEEAMALPPERVEPCVMGVAFAFAMMNSLEMSRLLQNSAIPYAATVRSAFQNGLVYGLVFCEWFAPGFLAEWKPQGQLEEKLVGLARAESELNRKRGYPLAFQLENMIAG